MPINEQQSTSRQHPVPQNVMDVEFKVIGDLTVRQLMYLFAGMVAVYSFYKTGLPTFWKYIFISISGALSIAVAFIPIQERGLDKWLVSFIKAMISPTQMVWRKTYSPPAYFLADYAQIIKNEIITLTPAKSRNKLDEYLGQLPESMTSLDKLENKRLDDIQLAFAKPYDGKLPISSTPSFDEPLGMPSGLRYQEPITETITIPNLEPEIEEREKETKTETERKVPETKPKPKEEKPPQRKEINKSELESKMEMLQAMPKLKIRNESLNQVDRVMTNLPPELKGEINIKTTSRIPKTIVAESIKNLKSQESSLEKKVAELLDVAKKAKTELKEEPAKAAQAQSRIEFFSEKFNKLKEEKEDLATALSKSSSNVESIEEKEGKETLVSEVTDLKSKNEMLSQHLAAIQRELFELKNPSAKENQEEPKAVGITGQSNTPDSTQINVNDVHLPPHLRKKQTQVSDQRANIIHGIVKDKDGNLVENAVIIIKDSNGDVMRALKTNQLGQFKTQTAVPNGGYTVEAIKGGQKFDIISVEAFGQPIRPINLIANE